MPAPIVVRFPFPSIVQTEFGEAFQLREPLPAEGEELITIVLPAGAVVMPPAPEIVALRLPRSIVYVTV